MVKESSFEQCVCCIGKLSEMALILSDIKETESRELGRQETLDAGIMEEFISSDLVSFIYSFIHPLTHSTFIKYVGARNDITHHHENKSGIFLKKGFEV